MSRIERSNEKYKRASNKRALNDEPCPACKTDVWPAVNWREGVAYLYCPECGHEESLTTGKQ